MTETVDANVLLYASNTTSGVHAEARAFIRRVGRGPDLFYLFWPTIMAYLRIATHPGIFDNPLSPAMARHNIDRLLARPHVRSPGEDPTFWPAYTAATEDVVVRGNLVPDSHLVGLMRSYGVTTIWTRDSDFKKFANISVRDPFTRLDKA